MADAVERSGPPQRREAPPSTPCGNAEPSRKRSRFEARSLDAVLEELDASRDGLTSDEARRRREAHGPNEIDEHDTNPLWKVFGYFWGPIPWMIEVAAALSAVVRHWADLIIILALLAVNAGIGFWQEHQAENAVAELKKTLARKSQVRRDGAWKEISARDLVAGDLVKLDIGAVVPADIKLMKGDRLSVDQSALTGESLPVDKRVDDVAYSGSHTEQGSMTGIVVATGMETVFGETARLVAEAGSESEIKLAVARIARYLIALSVVLITIMVAVELIRGREVLTVIQFALILAIAAIPVAMPAVLSVTMAVGAIALARRKAIVSRLDAIEELAGIDVLCVDKTGTLTENKLKLREPVVLEGGTQDVVLAAALATPEDNPDAIDRASIEALPDKAALDGFEQLHFTPFDYVNKRTEAEVRGDGRSFKVAKGAPQNMVELAHPDEERRQRVEAVTVEAAEKGYRTLGVTRDDGDGWRLIGLLPMEDPPRRDAKATIEKAQRHGLSIKMLTGDNIAIARQVARTLELGDSVEQASVLGGGTEAEARAGQKQAGKDMKLSDEEREKVQAAAGFAEVFPEHKFRIVKGLQDAGHLVAMTGDGVNDAPALKQANVGIAVEGATDTARAAAALVLTEPGLDVIIDAIEQARRIFERMNAYATYRVAETLRIMLFVVASVAAFNLYPITAILVILLALLNDLPIMTIAYDRTRLSEKPVRWNMKRVLRLATVLGALGVASTFGAFAFARLALHMKPAELQSLIFLKLVFAGHLTLFVTRSNGRFWSRPFPSPILLGAVIATQLVAGLIVGFGWFVAKLPVLVMLGVYAYAIVWMLISDQAKLLVRRFATPQ